VVNYSRMASDEQVFLEHNLNEVKGTNMVDLEVGLPQQSLDGQIVFVLFSVTYAELHIGIFTFHLQNYVTSFDRLGPDRIRRHR